MSCWRISAIMFFLLGLAGCSPSSALSVDDAGAGTELGYSGMGRQTAAQDAYISFICRQAGAPVGNCSAVDWNDFVAAGMNDIDRRCDLYLAWLDNRKRSQGPIQKQIGDTLTVTTAVMTATGATATAIGIVGAAFGFAHDTFENSYTRLLMEVNHSTVQTIVLSNQKRFRNDISGVRIAGRPQAVYALRQYLRICMPFTIENEINTSITTLQLGGAQALERSMSTPLVDVSSLTREAAKPNSGIKKPPYNLPKNDVYKSVLEDTKSTSTKLIKSALANICAPPTEIENPTAATNARIKVFQEWRKQEKPEKLITGKLDTADIASASDAGQAKCNTTLSRNYFEKVNFGTGIKESAGKLIKRLNARLPPSEQLPESASEDDIRRSIAKVRKSMASELQLNDPELADQLTLEFTLKLAPTQ